MTSGCPRRPYWNTWIPRTEGNILLLIFMYVRWLVDKLPDPPPSLSSGCCGGPEWAERIAFNSKPIRMHFCCTPRPPISSLGRLSCTDDVTDCCEHCFHGNAYHRFGLHFRELSLHSPTPPPPPLSHPTLCVPSLPPSLLTPHLMRTEERWVEGLVGGLTAVDRKNVMVRNKKQL